MLYPILPVYLKTIGFSVVFIGILEGTAEACAGLSKGYFGKISDSRGKRMPFVRWGYIMSAIAKPLMGMAILPLWIFFARTLDRFGKGIRTGARDALLSDEASPTTKGSVFGFHRALDTFGAVLGPAIGLIYLHYNPNAYRTLFFIAFIPGIFTIVLSFLIHDKMKNSELDSKSSIKSNVSPIIFLRDSPIAYKRLIIGLLIFALFNSSDVFLLLKVKECGISDSAVIGVYIFYNLVYALFSLPLGTLADKIGFKNILLFGLILYAAVYFGMASVSNYHQFVLLFLLYGIYAAATEGISKAWISITIDRSQTATAIGTFSGIQSICRLFASSFTGLIWYNFGANYALLITATIAIIVIVYLYFFTKNPNT
jgi:MFS family permease